MLKIGDNEKILGVVYQNNSWSKRNVYYYIVEREFKVPEHGIIVLQPNIYQENFSGNMPDDFKLQWVFVVEEIDPSINDGAFVIDTSKINDAKRPFFYATVDLTRYFDSVKKISRKFELEKVMNKAARKVEKLAKYKAVAELDPSLKDIFDEYVNIVSEENKKLLNSGK